MNIFSLHAKPICPTGTYTCKLNTNMENSTISNELFIYPSPVARISSSISAVCRETIINIMLYNKENSVLI